MNIIELMGLPWYIEQVKKFLLSEYFLWIIFGGLVSARFLVFYSQESGNIINLFAEYYFDLLVGILLVLFPFVFNQVFGNTPLQAIKSKRAGELKQNIVISGAGNIVHMSKDDSASKKQGAREQETVTTATQLLIQLTRNAELLANKIYTRSGVYLIFGVLIAFSGILYFSFQSISINGELDNVHTLIILAPRFGILFFIEFIAFFFLKQYRAAMDEFRHYDTIKRNRESQLAIFLMATNEFSEKNFNTVVEKVNFFEQVGKLTTGETTELLELSKINKNELEILKDLISDLAKQRNGLAK
ncbi:MAG: hypothetical protein PHQ60_15850 [Sideroxydans sp.]|nr:hypothetical protein [Sideroxydans sp.]